jgi:hypothetical protein
MRRMVEGSFTMQSPLRQQFAPLPPLGGDGRKWNERRAADPEGRAAQVSGWRPMGGKRAKSGTCLTYARMVKRRLNGV